MLWLAALKRVCTKLEFAHYTLVGLNEWCSAKVQKDSQTPKHLCAPTPYILFLHGSCHWHCWRLGLKFFSSNKHGLTAPVTKPIIPERYQVEIPDIDIIQS